MKPIIALTAALIATQASADTVSFFAVVQNQEGEQRTFMDRWPVNLVDGYTAEESAGFQCAHLSENHVANRVAHTPSLDGFTTEIASVCTHEIE